MRQLAFRENDCIKIVEFSELETPFQSTSVSVDKSFGSMF